MTTDPDIIDQAARVIRPHMSGGDAAMGEHRELARELSDAGLLRDSDQIARFAEAVAKVTPCTCSAQRERAEMAEAERDKARAEQDRLADIIKGLYETIDDERATIRKLVRERMQAQAERNMAVGKVDEMRQRLAIVMAEQHATEQDD